MTDLSDADLLERFARENSGPAFTTLVERHLGLVHSVALRHTASPQHAQDISQAVFILLARKAASLNHRTVLSGWLYHTARLTAANFQRAETRRLHREQEAFMQSTLHEPATGRLWSELSPHLDEAMSHLATADRDALILRYFQNQTLPQVGAALGLEERTAQKRVTRAVEKLRKFFTKRGVTLSAAAIATAISANSVQAVPAGLATVISTIALSGTTVATTTFIAATKAIAMTTLQKTIVTTALITTVGAGVFEAHQASQLRAENQGLQQQLAPLAEQNQQLSNALAGAISRKVSLEDQLAKDAKNNLELLKARNAMSQLKNQSAIASDPAYQKAQLWLAKLAKLHQLFNDQPDQAIPELRFLTDEEWLDLARKADLDTAIGIRCALSNARGAAVFDFANKIDGALGSYMAVNHQQQPDSISQLDPHFHPPVADVDTLLARYTLLTPSQQADPNYQGAVFTQTSSLDPIDPIVLIGTKTITWAARPNWPSVLPDALNPVVKAYDDANQHGFMSIYDLKPYATTPEQKAALDQVIKASVR